MGSRDDEPYKFPKTKHVRTELPRVYRDYKSYKPHLRREFAQKCVYCRRPDSLSPSDEYGFGVEHYRPKSRFPDLATTYGNLFYACNACNIRKADYWPSEQSSPFIPNPCDHVMTAHVRFDGPNVRSMSEAGQFLIETMQLADEELVSFRRSTVSIFRILRRKVAELVATRASMLSTREGVDLDDFKELDEEIEALRTHIARLSGSTLAGVNES